MVKIRLRPFILKNVLEVISAKWAAIFPLRVASVVAFSDGDPAIFAHRLTWPRICLLEPRDDERRFWFELPVGDVVVWERAVERILVRYERHRNIIAPGRQIRIIEAAVTARPIRVPTTLEIWYRIVTSGLFPNPKNRSHDAHFPREALGRRSRTCWHKNLRFNFKQRLLPQLHRIFRKICGSRIWRS